MKIVYHHRTQGTGAEGVHIAHVIKGFRALGHEVRVASPNQQDPSQSAGESPFSSPAQARARVLHKLSRTVPQWAFEGLELAYNVPSFRSLANAFNGNPSLLYERYAFFMATGAYWASRTRTPYIVEVNEISGHARLRGQVFTRTAKQFERFVFSRADALVVVSRFLKQEIAARGIDCNKIHVIPNGVDETLFAKPTKRHELRQRLGIAESTVVVGFVGWFVAWHNLPMLINAFADACVDQDAKLLLVGEGLLRSELEALARERGVGDRLVWPGPADYRRVPEFVDAMDVCVVPDSNEYRSPIKLFEYMAMAKPVVAPDYEPITSIVTHEVNAFLFPKRDRAALATTLGTLLEDEALRRRIGTEGRATVLERHLWRHVTQRICDIYEKIAAQPRKPNLVLAPRCNNTRGFQLKE